MIQNLIWHLHALANFLFDSTTNNPTESIAISALLLTIWQGWLSRKHNKLSVTPSLAFLTTTDKQDEKKRSATITVKNTGLGPAIIDRYIIGKHGEQSLIEGRINPDAWGFLLSNLCELKGVDLCARRISSNRMISPDEEIEILNVTYITPKDREFDIHKETGLAMKYRSLYGETFYSGYGSIKPRTAFFWLRIFGIYRRALKLLAIKS